MGADASIYSLIRQPQAAPGPLEQYGSTLQLKSLMDQQGLAALQRKQLESAIAEDDAVKAFYGNLGTANPRDRIGDLLRVSPKAGMQAQKFYQESDKTKADLLKTDRENLLALAEQSLKDMKSVTPETWGAYRDRAIQMAGMFVTPEVREIAMKSAMAMPAQFDPNYIKNNLLTGEQLFNPKPQAVGGKIVDMNAQTNPSVIGKDVTPTQAESAQIANHDLIPDGNGGYKVNQPLIQAKSGIASAGAARNITNVNSYTPASEEAQKEFMKSSRVNYENLRNVPSQLQNLDKAKKLIGQSSPFVGSFGDKKLSVVQFLNNNLGTNIAADQVANAGELRTRVFQNIMDNLKKMDAQPSQMQQQIMMDALGNLNTDPKAMKQMLDAYADVLRSKVAIHNKEVAGAQKQGVKFPYDPIIDMRSSSPGGGQFTQEQIDAELRRRGVIK